MDCHAVVRRPLIGQLVKLQQKKGILLFTHQCCVFGVIIAELMWGTTIRMGLTMICKQRTSIVPKELINNSSRFWHIAVVLTSI